MFCHHGGNNHKSWWILHRDEKTFLQSKSGYLDGLDSKYIDVLVYVKVQTFMAKTLLNQLMTYIGGQVKIQCSHHKLPLIISNKENVYCYHHKSGTGVKCSKKVKYQCPQLICQCGI